MANTIAPFGFRPVRRREGGAYSGGFITCKMQNNAGALNRGDMVTRLADGTVAVGSAGLITAGITIGGIAIGVHYLSTALGYPIWSNYWPGAGAAGLVDVMVIDDIDVVYEVQASAGPITLADVGSNADVVIAASTTGFSKWSLGAPNAAAGGAAFPWKIIGVGNNGVNIGDGYDAASANNIVEVIPNAQWLRVGQGI
jgi:hypothetical protein